MRAGRRSQAQGVSLPPMSQIFPRRANAIVRMSLAGVLGAVLLIGWIVFTLMRSSWATKQNEYVEQPIQFSHAHHAGGMGIDCRYCHTSVEQSAFAGIPPTKTCMNCHSQIWSNAPILEPVRASFRDNTNLSWIRVYDLPDFVYFSHQIHVRQGVGCATCHGQVNEMPLTYQASPLLMEWCLDCHRAPEQYLAASFGSLQHGLRSTGRPAPTGSRIETAIQRVECRALDQLLGVSPVTAQLRAGRWPCTTRIVRGSALSGGVFCGCTVRLVKRRCN